MKKIIVVGGGVIGWFTAAYMIKHHPEYKVCLIESPQVPILGVGESTIPQLGDMLRALDVDEQKWTSGVHGIHKYGNMFVSWNSERPTPHVEDHWSAPKHHQQFYPFAFTFRDSAFKRCLYNPLLTEDLFFDNDGSYGVDHKSLDYLLALVRSGKYPWYDITDYTAEQYPFVKNNKSIHDNDGVLMTGKWKSYAWHVDAERFPLIVRDQVALPLGVEWIQDHIEQINKNEQGCVTSLTTKSGNNISGDLFLDCTGFHRLLMRTMGTEWVSMSDKLPTQSAWVAPVKYNNVYEEMRPYTQSYAQANGWNFIITLYSRMGSGYIFDNRCEDNDSARERFIRYWDSHEFIREPRLITWQQGYYKDAWVKNVVGMGMGQGFVDPMEANSIYVAQSCIEMLSKALKKYSNVDITDHTKRAFSRHTQKLENQICDFISYHFTLSRRRDSPMWRKWGEKGIQEGHAVKNWKEYRNPRGYLGRNIFLDYQWAQQQHYLDQWDNDLCKLNYKPELLELADITFNYIKQKSAALAKHAPHIYDWSRQHLYGGATSEEILQQALSERK